jgi:hypothetical protein
MSTAWRLKFAGCAEVAIAQGIGRWSKPAGI